MNIFSGQNLRKAIHCKFSYLKEMKAWIFYIHLTYTIFLDSWKVKVNQANIHLTSTILNVVQMFIKLSYDLKKLLKGYFLFLPIPARILFRYSRCLEAALNFFLAASIISRCTLHTHYITINNCLVHLILDTGKHSHIHRILFL